MPLPWQETSLLARRLLHCVILCGEPYMCETCGPEPFAFASLDLGQALSYLVMAAMQVVFARSAIGERRAGVNQAGDQHKLSEEARPHFSSAF